MTLLFRAAVFLFNGKTLTAPLMFSQNYIAVHVLLWQDTGKGFGLLFLGIKVRKRRPWTGWKQATPIKWPEYELLFLLKILLIQLCYQTTVKWLNIWGNKTFWRMSLSIFQTSLEKSFAMHIYDIKRKITGLKGEDIFNASYGSLEEQSF